MNSVIENKRSNLMMILFTFWKTSMGFIFVPIFGCPFVFTFDGLNYSITPRQNDVMFSRRQGNGLCTHFPTFIVDPGHNLLFVFVHLKYFHIYHTSEVSIIHSDLFFVRNVQKIDHTKMIFINYLGIFSN